MVIISSRDWPSNCQHLPPADILSPVDVSKRLALTLRVNERCDFVIAISHMRLTEDLEVANATMSADTKVDLILGGHDHQVLCRLAGDTDVDPEVIIQGKDNSDIVVDGKVHPDAEGDVRIVKSGTDWKSYSVIHLLIDSSQCGKATIRSSRGPYTIYNEPSSTDGSEPQSNNGRTSLRPKPTTPSPSVQR